MESTYDISPFLFMLVRCVFQRNIPHPVFLVLHFHINWFLSLVLVLVYWIFDRLLKEAPMRWRLALFSNKYHGSVHASQSLLSRILRSSTRLVFQTVHPLKSSHRARIGTGGVPRGNELDRDISELDRAGGLDRKLEMSSSDDICPPCAPACHIYNRDAFDLTFKFLGALTSDSKNSVSSSSSPVPVQWQVKPDDK